MSDPECTTTLKLTKDGGVENIGDTPNSAAEFIKRYEQDSDYQDYISRIWGERAYDTRPKTIIDSRTRAGIDNGWGYECTGKQNQYFV